MTGWGRRPAEAMMQWMADHVGGKYKAKRTKYRSKAWEGIYKRGVPGKSVVRAPKRKRKGRKAHKKGRKAKKGRYSHSSGMPTWFATLAKGCTPDRVAGTYGNSIENSGTANKKVPATFYKHLAIVDLDTIAKKYIGATSATTPANDAQRYYLTNKRVKHVFRNNGNSACVIQFYLLQPRRDIPATGVPAIAPSTSLVYGTGGAAFNPAMYIQAFSDEGTVATRIAYDDLAATPFMSPTLCSLFKIRPLDRQELEPGATYTREEHFKGPIMVSYNKFGLGGGAAQTIALAYECLKQTPLLFAYFEGTASHDSVDRTLVATGLVQVDYVQSFSYDVWKFDTAQVPVTTNPVTGGPSFTAYRQVDEATGADVTEAFDA